MTSPFGSPAVERRVELGALPGGEPVGAAAQQPAGPEQRVVGEAAVPEGVLLDPAADLVDAGQAEFDDVEGVEHPDRVGQLGGQRGGVPAERVQRGGDDRGPPRLVPVGEPGAQHPARTGPATTSSSRAGRPGVRSAMPVAYSVGWVPVARRNAVSSTPERGHAVEPGRVVDQRFPAFDDLGHDGVPGHAELVGDGGDGPVVVADLLERPLPGPVGEHRPRGDRVVLFGPGLVRAQRVSALEDPLAPPQQHRHPAIGRSRTVTVRRSLTRATAPHSAQPTRSRGVSTPRCHSPSTFSAEQHLESGQAEQGSNMVVHLGLLAS